MMLLAIITVMRSDNDFCVSMWLIDRPARHNAHPFQPRT